MVCVSSKVEPQFFKFFIWNPCLCSPSLTILVCLLYIISLVFFYLSKLSFPEFRQFRRNFVHGQNNSKCCDWAPLSTRVSEPQASIKSLCFYFSCVHVRLSNPSVLNLFNNKIMSSRFLSRDSWRGRSPSQLSRIKSRANNLIVLV